MYNVFEIDTEYQSRYIARKDSIYDESLTTKLMKVESEFLTRENRERLAAQAEIIALNEKVIRQQDGINLLISLFSVMLMFFLIFFYRGYQMKKNINNLLEKRIGERTRELEDSRDSLLRLLYEKDLLIQRILQAFSNTRKTIEGLCANGGLESVHPSEIGYHGRILLTLNQFANYCQSIKKNQGNAFV